MDKKKVTHLVTRRVLPATGLVGVGLLLANLTTASLFLQRSYNYITNAPKTGAIEIHAFDGTRQPLDPNIDMLVRVIDGNQKEVLVKYVKGGSLKVEGLEYFDNFGDMYTVIVWSKGYRQAGFHPVRLQRGQTVSIDLMLMPSEYQLNFSMASWDQLKTKLPALHAMLSNGLTDQAAQARYEQLMRDQPLVLAHLLNVSAALSQLKTPSGEVILSLYKQVIFDSTLKQNNFFAYADKRLVDELRKAVAQRTFEYAAGSQFFHAGNIASFKELSFYEANVQMTFYADGKTIDGVDCYRMETDIDYYRDPAAHILLEVLPNTIGGALTSPLEGYQLRWIASRVAGRPVFEPLYTVELKKKK